MMGEWAGLAGVGEKHKRIGLYALCVPLAILAPDPIAAGPGFLVIGLFAGTAVNDTSSVVATGYAFSEAAGDFATMVKLTRTLAIIPTVIVFALVQLNLKRKEAMALQQDGSALKAEFSIKKD